MSDKGCIVCATRGGEGSRVVQMEAIHLAKQMDKSLVFIYVIDALVLSNVDNTLVDAVHEELLWMGKTLLRIAQRRAGVEHLDADLVIREGNVPDEISRFLKESKADTLLLGTPRGTTANVFGDDAIEQFALSIQERTGVDVMLIRPEEHQIV